MWKIRRNWTAASADEWTKEDWIAIVLSPIAYILLTLGFGLSLLFLWQGFVMLGAGIIVTIVMHLVIDPKLRVISAEYEKQQKAYLQNLERSNRWEDTHG
jgi:hypothetical protein